MASIAMPLVVVNLGAEMLYILDQRLKAQCIADDKSRQVLNDVVRTWFDHKFVEALFKPQQLYSLTATREVFERLAHSSIMRLNSSRYSSSSNSDLCRAFWCCLPQTAVLAVWRSFLISWSWASNIKFLLVSTHQMCCR